MDEKPVEDFEAAQLNVFRGAKGSTFPIPQQR